MTTYFLFSILFYFHNHSLFSYFCFFYFLFLIMYLRLIAVVSLFAFILYLFTFCYFTLYISNHSLVIILNKTTVFIQLKAVSVRSYTQLLLYISDKPVKYAREKVLFSLNLQAVSLHFY